MEQIAIRHDEGLLVGFNEVLGQHLERLLGFKLGPAGMPLTVTTLACLALISDRKGDLQDADAGAGYTAEGLLAELSDMGLREYGECEDILRQLTEKGYVRPVREGGVMPNPVALRMEELLERIFPKMPGLNFVAYVTQTMGEVKTGRKDLSLALRQFDQTLIMQGLSVVRRKSGPSSGERPPALRRDPRLPISSHQPVLPPRPRQEPTVPRLKPDELNEPQGPRILGSGAASVHAEVREFRMGELGPDSEGGPETEAVIPNQSASALNVEETEDQRAETVEGHSVLSIQGETPTETAKGTGGGVLVAPDADDNAPKLCGPSEPEAGGDASAVQEPPPVTLEGEERLEREVRAFEEELSLWCPMCNKDRLEASTTPTGRTYYKCLSPDCHFVSWGKPLHHPCPRCNNPFLIQVSDKSGRMAHKCPRATCHFHRLVGEDGSAPHTTGVTPRKVVRRRVVRRSH